MILSDALTTDLSVLGGNLDSKNIQKKLIDYFSADNNDNTKDIDTNEVSNNSNNNNNDNNNTTTTTTTTSTVSNNKKNNIEKEEILLSHHKESLLPNLVQRALSIGFKISDIAYVDSKPMQDLQRQNDHEMALEAELRSNIAKCEQERKLNELDLYNKQNCIQERHLYDTKQQELELALKYEEQQLKMKLEKEEQTQKLEKERIQQLHEIQLSKDLFEMKKEIESKQLE